MQLTRFDRWLREKFVYELHIHTLRPPDPIPHGIRCVTLPESAGTRYKHLYITSNNKAAASLIRQMKDNNQMYTTRIVDREAWYVPFVAPKDKSVSWRLISAACISISAFYFLVFIKGLAEDPEFRKNFLEALKLFRN